MSRYLLVALFCLINVKPGNAHMDVSGDVHPTVIVKKDQFVVYFRNNTGNRESQKLRYSSTLTSSGKFLSRRVSSAPPEYSKPPLKLTESNRGINIPKNDSYYVIPNWFRKHKGTPFIIKIKDKKKELLKPDWDKSKIDIVHSATVTENHFVFVTTESSSAREASFSFNYFNKNLLSKRLEKTIGIPFRIYNFSVSSNALLHREHVYLAWMGGRDKKFGLYLSRLNPDTDNIETKYISKGFGNTSVSIGGIGDYLLISYHDFSGIVYEHIDIKNIF